MARLKSGPDTEHQPEGAESLRENPEGLKEMVKPWLRHATVGGHYSGGFKTKDPGVKAQIVGSVNGPTKVGP